jgi:hypothetical protein
MKRTWTALLSMLLSATPAALQAQLTYATNADHTLTITGYTGDAADLSIPGVFDGLAVTIIGTNAFQTNSILTSVTMPTNITGIDDEAFSGCSNLVNIVISPNITNIGNGAFGVCPNLTNITIPAGVATIGNFAFIFCSNLGSITVPSSVSTVGQAAFQSCSGLTNLTIASGVASIMDDAFASCSGLPSVSVPGSVSNIGVGVFAACTGLLNANLGNGLTSVGVDMFQSCSKMTGVTIPASVTNIGASAFAGTQLAGVTLPSGLLSIGDYAFSATGLTNLIIPGGLLSIGGGAFSETSLAGVMIPASVTNIGPNVFSVCSKLTNITVAPQNSFFSSSNGVLFDLNRQTLLAYPDALGGAYLIPATVQSVAEGAFAGGSLVSVTIPASVTDIGTNAFYDCANLETIFFEGNAPATDPAAFADDLHATIFYLPGATGWSSPFAGLPAMPVEVVTWTNPAPILYGAPLSSNQLNAVADVPGSFAYLPTNGSLLPLGANTLSVVFTPSNIVNYASVTNTVPLTVNPALVSIVSGLTANNKIYDRTTSATLSSNNVALAGVVPGDTVSLDTNGYAANFASASVGNGIAVTVSGLTLSGAGAGNYTLTQPAGLLANITSPSVLILASKPNIVISWSTNATDYMLKQTASLAPPVAWSPVTNGITLSGTNNTVTINAGSGAQYFALIGAR